MTADSTTKRYCPCNGTCHDSDNPCSLDCFAHHSEVKEHPEWFGIGADPTKLREALARAICDSDDGPHSFDTEHSLDQEQYLINADAILASLVEHRDDVLDVLGAEQVGWLQDADTPDPAPVKMNGAMGAFDVDGVDVVVPVYAFRPKEQP